MPVVKGNLWSYRAAFVLLCVFCGPQHALATLSCPNTGFVFYRDATSTWQLRDASKVGALQKYALGKNSELVWSLFREHLLKQGFLHRGDAHSNRTFAEVEQAALAAQGEVYFEKAPWLAFPELEWDEWTWESGDSFFYSPSRVYFRPRGFQRLAEALSTELNSLDKYSHFPKGAAVGSWRIWHQGVSVIAISTTRELLVGNDPCLSGISSWSPDRLNEFVQNIQKVSL
jgi:hypothetical protein